MICRVEAVIDNRYVEQVTRSAVETMPRRLEAEELSRVTSADKQLTLVGEALRDRTKAVVLLKSKADDTEQL